MQWKVHRARRSSQHEVTFRQSRHLHPTTPRGSSVNHPKAWTRPQSPSCWSAGDLVGAPVPFSSEWARPLWEGRWCTQSQFSPLPPVLPPALCPGMLHRWIHNTWPILAPLRCSEFYKVFNLRKAIKNRVRGCLPMYGGRTGKPQSPLSFLLLHILSATAANERDVSPFGNTQTQERKTNIPT